MLLRKMLRDMRRQKMQFFSVLLMSFLGLLLYSGLSAMWYGVEHYLNKYNQDTNLADAWVYGDNFTDDALKAIAALESVSDAERRLRLIATGVSEYRPSVWLYFLERNEISLPLVIEGAEIDLTATDSVWLDARFAEASGFSVGDTFSLEIGNIRIDKRIAGLCYSSELVFYQAATSIQTDYREIGFAFLSADAFPLREYLIDNVRSGDLNPEETLDEMILKDYPALIDALVDSHYEDIINALVEDDYDSFVRELTKENYDAIVTSLAAEKRDAIIDRYVRENYETLFDDKVETEYDQIISDYVAENYDEILEEYVTQNRAAIIDEYVTANYEALLRQYAADNRAALISGYVSQNFNTLVNTYIEGNFLSILDTQIQASYTEEQIAALGGIETLRQAAIANLGGVEAAKRVISDSVTEEMLAAGISVSLSDDELTALISEEITVAEIKNQVSANISNADLIALAKERYSVTDLTEIVSEKYTVDDVKSLARDKYAPGDIITIVSDEYSNEDLAEIIRENYSTDALADIVLENYSSDDVRQLVRDNMPPQEMKDKLLAEYTTDDVREMILEHYPGEQLRDFMVEQISEMSETDIEERRIFNEVVLKTSRTDLTSLESELNEVTDVKISRLFDRDTLQSVASLPERLDSQKTISDIFPTAFIAVAILTIITTMSRIVSGQRTQIGTLRALGFSKRKITLHYMGYGFFAAAIGSFLGVIVGPLTMPYILYRAMSRMYSLPQWESATAYWFWLVAAACAFACTMATFFTVRGVLSETPANALRPKTSDKLNLTKAANGKLWRRLSFSVQWNLRDIFRSKVRSAMGVIGAISSMALLLTGLSLQDTFNDTMEWIYGDIQHYKTQIMLVRDADIERAENLSDELGGQLMMSAAIEISFGADTKPYQLTVIEDTELFRVTDENRNPLLLSEGDVVISRKLAEIFGVAVGDTFSWRLADSEDWIDSEIGVVAVSPMTQGITMTRNTLEGFGVKFTPRSIICANAVEPFESDIVSAFFSDKDLRDAWSGSMESLSQITIIMIVAASMLSVVVLYNLGMLSFTEKERELATLKVLGFKSSTMRHLLLTQNLWFSIAGILLGIPLGNWLNKQIVIMIGDRFDLTAVYTSLSLCVCAVFVLTISVATNLLFSKKLKTLDMVSALKSVD